MPSPGRAAPLVIEEDEVKHGDMAPFASPPSLLARSLAPPSNGWTLAVTQRLDKAGSIVYDGTSGTLCSGSTKRLNVSLRLLGHRNGGRVIHTRGARDHIWTGF